MNERSGMTWLPLVSRAERSVAGRNWEMFRNAVDNSAQAGMNSGKENLERKLTEADQKLKRKRDVVGSDRATQMRMKDVRYNEDNKKKLTEPDGKSKRKRQSKRKPGEAASKGTAQILLKNVRENDDKKNKSTEQTAMDCETADTEDGRVAPNRTSKRNGKLKGKPNEVVSERTARMLFKDVQGNDDNKKKLTKQVAMDCEMVGIEDGTKSMVARVSLVNRHGHCIYDKYVKAREPVVDYRTKVSGIRPGHLQNGEEFSVVQKEVAEILKGRILVGHAIKHDLAVLFLSHPRKHLRDTSTFKPFRQLSRGNTPSLKKLAHDLLGKDIQTGEHSSVEDARATMQLYGLYRNKWESEIYCK